MKYRGRLHEAIATTLLHALVETNYNMVATARVLGISRSTLYRMLQRYELKDFRGAAKRLTEIKYDDC